MQRCWKEEPHRRRRCRLLPRGLILIFRRLRLHNSAGPSSLIELFSSKEIIRATFGLSAILGSDSNGNIYKAEFPNGFIAAVRKVRASEAGGSSFCRDVELLARLYHRHILRLRGFSEGHDRFLVFDYMANGSLKDCLHDPLRTPLNWRTRLQISISVAAALEYLLFFCDPPIYNISIASTNIFLDENFVAKICLFGVLSPDNHASEENSAHSTGFVDPRRRNVIFQFGVLLLELVTGQSYEGEGAELIRWVQNSGFTCTMHKMVDADLGDNYSPKELRAVLIVARMCTRISDYPIISIRHILRYLQKKAES